MLWALGLRGFAAQLASCDIWKVRFTNLNLKLSQFKQLNMLSCLSRKQISVAGLRAEYGLCGGYGGFVRRGEEHRVRRESLPQVKHRQQTAFLLCGKRDSSAGGRQSRRPHLWRATFLEAGPGHHQRMDCFKFRISNDFNFKLQLKTY